MQSLINQAEARYNSAEGLFRVDTAAEGAQPGRLPQPIEGTPLLAQRQAERQAAQRSILTRPDDETGLPPTGCDMAMIAGTVLTAFAALIGASVWLASRLGA